jgi:hypothetical protein
MKTVNKPRQVALVVALGLCAGVSGCSWISAILAETPTLPPVDAAPRAQLIAKVGDDIQLAASKESVKGTDAIELPQVLAQPSRHVAEKTTAAPAVQASPDAAAAAATAIAAAAAAAPEAKRAPAAAPAVAVAYEGTPESDLLRRLESWRQAWESGRFEAYQRFYDGGFRGASTTRAAWESGRKARLGAPNISVRMSDVRTTVVGPDEVRVEFLQQYASAKHRDKGHKTMTLRRDPQKGWVIVEENWRESA